jgi:hypothetical protein
MPGVPFATPARGERRITLECHFSNPRGHDVQRFFGAGVGGKANSPLRGSKQFVARSIARRF